MRLITLLQNGQSHTLASMRQALGVSRRTLFRDLDVLGKAGIPLFHEKRGGYRLGRTFSLPPVSLSVTETLGLMLLAKTAAAQRDQPLADAAVSAVDKLLASVPLPMREACAGLMQAVSIHPGQRALVQGDRRHYALLQRCIDEKRACRMVYAAPGDGEGMTCELEPYALHFAERAWYVLGRADVYEQVRVFKLSRIRELTAVERPFERPSGWTVADKLGQAWQLIPDGKVHDIELLFEPMVATNVSEVLWHASQSHELRADGRCVMRFRVDGLGEIAWWICGYADQVTVVKPAALRKRVATMLAQAAQRYDAK